MPPELPSLSLSFTLLPKWSIQSINLSVLKLLIRKLLQQIKSKPPVRVFKLLCYLAPLSSTFTFPPHLTPDHLQLPLQSMSFYDSVPLLRLANLPRLTLDIKSSRNPSLNPQTGFSASYLCFHLSLHPTEIICLHHPSSTWWQRLFTSVAPGHSRYSLLNWPTELALYSTHQGARDRTWHENFISCLGHAVERTPCRHGQVGTSHEEQGQRVNWSWTSLQQSASDSELWHHLHVKL